MAAGSSYSLRLQPPSQGWKQTRPQTRGSGFSWMIFSQARPVLVARKDHGRFHVFPRRAGLVAGSHLVQVNGSEITPRAGLGGQSSLERQGHGGKRTLKGAAVSFRGPPSLEEPVFSSFACSSSFQLLILNHREHREKNCFRKTLNLTLISPWPLWFKVFRMRPPGRKPPGPRRCWPRSWPGHIP